MKIYVIVMGFACAFTISNLCGTNQEHFLKANIEYRAQKYQDALDLYQRITHKTDIVWYNMGLCFFKLGKYGYAVWAFRSALRNASSTRNFDRALNGIAQTYQKLTRVKPNSLFNTFTTMIRRRTVATNLLWWQIALIIGCYLLIGMGWYGLRKYGMVVCFLITIVFMVLASIVCIVKWVDYGSRQAVITEQVDVLSGPYPHAHKQESLGQAEEIVIKGIYNGWYKIKSGTIIGWVPQNTIQVVE